MSFQDNLNRMIEDLEKEHYAGKDKNPDARRQQNLDTLLTINVMKRTIGPLTNKKPYIEIYSRLSLLWDRVYIEMKG